MLARRRTGDFSRCYEIVLPENKSWAVLRRLHVFNNAAVINDLRAPPANCLEKLGGRRVDPHGIRIDEQWRLCFERKGSDGYNVEIVDYH
jgi:proteic killer suppression protein